MNAFMLARKLRALCSRDLRSASVLSFERGFDDGDRIHVTEAARDTSGAWEFEVHVKHPTGKNRYGVAQHTTSALVQVHPDLRIDIEHDPDFPKEYLACALEGAEM
jgi:hypothetical protein